jgi:predicted lipid-binding transport protein (Tim44 family)
LTFSLYYNILLKNLDNLLNSGSLKMQTFYKKYRVILFVLFMLTTLLWLGMESEVFARAGGGRSSGSRGYTSGKSYSQPSPTRTPGTAQQQGQVPPAASPTGAGRSFLSGIGGGIVGGLLGGMLFRSLGFAGAGTGEGGGFGMGDLVLILLILGIIYYVVKRFRSRNTMQMSAAGAGSYPSPIPSYEPVSAPPTPDLITEGSKVEGLRHIREMDPSFDEKAFKDLAQDIFFKIQGAWTKRDLSGVRNLLSREMFDIFQQDVNKLLAEKQLNRLENISVREVAIVEAAQDRGEEFVTVKFYANLLDYNVDDKNGQVIFGSNSDPVKFLEYWTFSRNVGEKNWALAGITQDNSH